jgi:hypothetical protein
MSNKKTQVSLWATFNLSNIANFPTRINNKSSVAMDSIFIDMYKFKNYSIILVVNSLSDHDVQLLSSNKLKILNSKSCSYTKWQMIELVLRISILI